MSKKLSIIFVTIIIVFLFLFSFNLYSISLKDHNLIIITLDTTRADYIGYYNHDKVDLTPNINRIARQGVSFKNCYTPVPLTLPAHCSLFTGRYPLAHGVRTNTSYSLPEDELTLAEIFKKQGYVTHAVVSAYVVASKFGLSQGFAVYDDALDSSNLINSFSSEIKARAVYNKFKLWFDKNHRKKFFSWVHFFDPHQPYEPPDPYSTKFSGDLYAGEVAYMDEYVGKIISDLKEKGIYEKTLVVIFGDHGEDLGEHQEYGHGTFCYNSSLEVPLIFSKNLGFRKGSFVNINISLVDVMPSLLELFGFKSNKTIQGQSFLNLKNNDSGKNSRLLYFESLYPNEEMGWAPVIGLIEDNFKYIHLPKSELYDLSADRGEKNNLFYKKYNISQRLNKKLEKFISDHSEEKAAFKKKLSSEDIKHLTSLGYISSFKKSKGLIDPKRGIAFQGHLRRVKQLIVDEQVDQAEKTLMKSVSDEPDIRTPAIYDLFVEIYMKKKDKARLIEIQQKGIKEFPHNNQLKINLANSYFNFTNFKAATRLCQDILNIDPTYSRAFILLGKINLNQNLFSEAKRNFKQAIQSEPRNYALKKMYSELLIKTGAIPEAVNSLKKIGHNKHLLDNPFDHPILVKVAARLISLKELTSAEAILNKIMEMDSKNPDALTEMAGLEIKRGNLEKASDLYDRAQGIDPESAGIHCHQGILNLIFFQKTKNRNYLDKARDKFNTSIDKNPYYAPAVNGRASVNLFSNRIEEAIEDWKKTIKIQPDFIDAYFNLGIAFIRLRQGGKALKYLNILNTRYLNRLPRSQQNRLARLIDEAKKAE